MPQFTAVLILLTCFADATYASAQETPQEPTQETPAAEKLEESAAAEGVQTAEQASADEASEMPAEYREELDKRMAKFKELRNQLADAILEQKAIRIRYFNLEDRSQAAKKSYAEARTRVRELLDENYTAALDVIRMHYDEAAGIFLVTMIQHRFDLDIYDAETLEGAARMIDGGSPLLYLYQAGARSAVVAGDFKIAKQLFEAVQGEEDIEEVDRLLLYHIDAHQKMFEAEKIIRDKEVIEDDLPRVLLSTTQGDVVLELFVHEAPSTVAHFIQLVEDGFYDGHDFHQVIDHLMAMTGDPTGDGSGGSGQYLIDEHENPNARNAFRGSLVMAKLPVGETGKFVPNSASSQFVIFYLPVISVSESQTVFGRVIEGMDVISRLRRVDPNKKKGKKAIVLPPDRIITATVIRRPEKLSQPKYLSLQR